MQQVELKSAIRKMIQVELDAMHYYLKASTVMRDEGAIFHFSLLADEEREHARSFYQIYPGDDLEPFDQLAGMEPADNNPVVKTMDTGLMARLDERQALQLAMKLEKEVETALTRMATEVRDPAAREVIKQNAESTQNHYEMIATDYARLYANEDDR